MKPLAVFYILVFYIFVQFSWWAYLLIDLNKEVYTHKIENISLKTSPVVSQEEQTEMLHKLHNRWIMIAGEGVVFLSLLILGAVKTRKAFKKEVALTQRQKNFLLSITHELKSPLASIKLYLQTLRKHDLDKQKQQSFIENAIKDADRLNTLVENVLTATKIESSKQLFFKEEINLSEAVRDISTKYIQSHSNKHYFEIHVTPDIHSVFDKQALSSVLINLLENAQKYSPEGSLIQIFMEKTANKVILKVVDEGTGIADEEKSSIFEKFYRVGNEETRRTTGTGLGLFIVKYIVENHNGRIHVKNNIPKGSIFEIQFNS